MSDFVNQFIIGIIISRLESLCLAQSLTQLLTFAQIVMSTQYNTIQAPYDEQRKSSIALIEAENVQSLVSPYINNARVLDLACGSGFYSHRFLEWGAKTVVGVDISSAMLAKARLAITDHSRIKFVERDCSQPQLYDEERFDLVFGAWFLNYASDREQMVGMLQNIALNLNKGGRFVGVTCVPTDEPAAVLRRQKELRPKGSGGLLTSVTSEVPDGIEIHLHADTPMGNVDFDNFYLTKDVYEKAAREGGMGGKLEWSVTDVTEDFLKRREGGASVEELKSYRIVPHFGVIVVGK
ncbi:MAG: hypothetical protein Q9216_006714 [Gyalolechia sp. 2 TL-2023]